MSNTTSQSKGRVRKWARRAALATLIVFATSVVLLWVTAPTGFRPSRNLDVKRGMTREQAIEVIGAQPVEEYDLRGDPRAKTQILFVSETPDTSLIFESDCAEIVVYLARGRVVGALGVWRDDHEPIQFRLARWISFEYIDIH
jgi:hypothetical protein